MKLQNKIGHRNNQLTLDNLSEIFFLLSLLLKPLYLQKSGTFQISDILLTISFILQLLAKGKNFYLSKIEWPLFVFILFVVIINSIYFYYIEDDKFLMSTLYYIFNFFVILLFRNVFDNRKFVIKIFWVFRISYLIQLCIYVLKLGHTYASYRYMGTFNDPNQMAFWLFSSLLFMQICSCKFNIKKYILEDFIVLFLIFLNASTGMILGMITYFIVKIAIAKFSGNKLLRTLKIVFSFFLVILLALIIIKPIPLTFIDTHNDLLNLVENRALAKIDKISFDRNNNIIINILEDREIDKVIYYPENFLYGSGEGNMQRFSMAKGTYEIHSTIIAIAFYYGIVPLIFFLSWIFLNFKANKLKKAYLWYYLSLLVESLTLANQRQPLFWMIIMLASSELKE